MNLEFASNCDDAVDCFSKMVQCSSLNETSTTFKLDIDAFFVDDEHVLSSDLGKHGEVDKLTFHLQYDNADSHFEVKKPIFYQNKRIGAEIISESGMSPQFQQTNWLKMSKKVFCTVNQTKK